MIEQLRARLRALLDERAAAQADLDGIVAGAEERGDGFLTADEQARLSDLRSKLATIDEQRDALNADIAALEEDEKRAAAAARLAKDIPVPAATPVRVTQEERVYRPDGEHGFLRDLYQFQVRGRTDAAERLERNNAIELEKRDMTTSTFNGFIPPAYLVDRFASLAYAGRPFLNTLQSLPLVDVGEQIIVPRVTQGSAAAATAEGSGWNEQDAITANVTADVELITAQQDISRVTFDRGGIVVDQVLFPDMVAAYETKKNELCISGSGTSPQHRGILNVSGIDSVTYTDASPTVAELWPKLADSIQSIVSNRFAGMLVMVMHPRRWAWLTAAVDTTGRPLFGFADTAPQNVAGAGNAAQYGQVVGSLQGVPVVTDGSVPTNLGAGTNEDRIIVYRSSDVLLWEDDGPMTFTFEQTTGPEKVRLAVGGYSAFMAGRYPLGISVISGTGLVTPTF